MTERYGHLRADLFKPADLLRLTVDLSRPGGEVIDLAARQAADAGRIGHAVATTDVDGAAAGGVSTDVR